MASLTKQAVAQRQIDAAIRMLLLHEEEPCAIYTVASAALGIVAHLAEKKGVGYTHETRRALEGVFKKDYGLDPANHEVAKGIDWWTDAIEMSEVTWRHRHKIANFLKHADRDPDTFIETESFTDTSGGFIATGTNASPGIGDVISMAINFYINLKLPITIEMFTFMHWWLGITAQKPEDVLNTKEGPVHLFTIEQQLDFGRGLLEKAYEVRSRNRNPLSDLEID